MQHFADCVEKKIVGECPEEQSYNACIDEIFRLTGKHMMYLDHNAMRRDLAALRQKHSSAQEEKETKRFAQILKTQDWQSQRAQEFIAKFKAIDDKRLSQFATEWKDLIKMEKEHEGSCTNKSVKCNGCSKVVCKHLGNYICSSRPVCAWCDSFGQPNPFNPKNRMAYLPKTKIADDLCKDIDHVEQNKRKS